ncbi:glycosyltransferase [Sphingobium sp. Sx8-8]|uniref:glycosyltransferase n=1 Tax=Sphingobium sp. Sx8-8 TaxID=2933617 RepID=UPI001F5A6143|nr:glycosyltransferase [Sphingobium sp. Sx8-8]
MRALFAVDHIFGISRNLEVFTIGGKFPYSAWQSYLDVFSRLTVISRARPLDDTTHQLSSEGPRVDFKLLEARRGIARLRGMGETRAAVYGAVAKADVVIARLPSETALLACAAARHYGKPYLVEVVACPWDALWFHGSKVARAYAPLFALRNRYVIKRAPAARYVTRTFLQGRYPTSGAQFVASNVELPTVQLNGPFNGFSDIVQIGTIGALHSRLKGIDVAMRALQRLKRTDPDLRFRYRVVGEGDATPFLRNRDALGLEQEVSFEGTLPPGEPIARWLDGLDLYLQPSYQEGLPRAVIEALSRGRIVIGSTAGGTPELLKPDRLHKPGDDEALSRIILEVLGTPKSQLAEEAQANVKIGQGFTKETILSARHRSLQALAQLAGGRSS